MDSNEKKANANAKKKKKEKEKHSRKHQQKYCYRLLNCTINNLNAECCGSKLSYEMMKKKKKNEVEL